MRLAELQRQFQEHVLCGDQAIIDAIETSTNATAATRLGIYSNAYRVRLIDALAASFPRLRELMGAESFSDAALDYIAAHPSNFRSIRWYGAMFAAALELTHRKHPWLADLAQWEWSLACAFDAPDAAPLQESDLAAIAPERWPALAFSFHPSLQRFTCTTNAPALFKALSEERPAPPPQQLSFEQHWLIWRQNLTTRYRSLDAVEARALDAALRGATFAAVCDEVCERCGPEEAALRSASLLRTWVAEGLLVGTR